MVNRIKEILKKYDLTASKFADSLEVPRSTISHILSERNKPSLEFIQKVLDKYPEIEVNWLLKGEGNIFGKERDLFSDFYEKPDVPHKSTEKITNNKKELPFEISIENDQDEKDVKYENPEGEKQSTSEAEYPSDTRDKTEKINKETGKNVIKIIFLYNDYSFEEFFPTQKVN
ncbi:MAG: XRE family transcriptional regulator [Bacteroidetes bacterium]|nr:MAG: XRE family transcriptional regulator [Bacteroidota bacterium]